MKRWEVYVDKDMVRGFAYKTDALKLACELRIKEGKDATYLVSYPKGAITYILHPDECSCMVCGNELGGKQHCPFCGARHYYGCHN